MAAHTPPPKRPEQQRSWFQIHLTTALVLMFLGGVMLPTLMKAWGSNGFVIVLLVILNALLLAAVLCEYLIRNTKRRWSDPPHNE